jgi:uncharacterized membrane protein AbrB (regulator of aidB expression)
MSPSAQTLATLMLMLLTPAPSLLYVIGLPAGLLIGSLVVGGAVFMVLGRMRRS